MIAALTAWTRNPFTWAAAVLVSMASAVSLYLNPPCALRAAPTPSPVAEVKQGPVEIPAEHRAAADAAAADFKSYRWTEGCHQYVRTMRGAVYWVAPAGQPNINSWEVGRRGWPKASCKSPTEPDAEPCDAKGVPVCGVGGAFLPGLTDGLWADVTGQGARVTSGK